MILGVVGSRHLKQTDAPGLYEQAILNLQPLAYWPMNEQSVLDASSLISDLSGNDYTAELHGSGFTFVGPPIRHGHPGAIGFSIDGGVGGVRVPTSINSIRELFDQGRSATVVLWLRRHQRSPGNYEFVTAFFENALFGRSRWRIYSNQKAGNGQLYFESPENRNLVIGPAIQDLQNTFITYRKDVSTQTYSAFVNGQWYSSAEAWSDPQQKPEKNPDGLHFPTDSYDLYTLQCYMSDMTLFDRAITNADVANLYNIGRSALT